MMAYLKKLKTGENDQPETLQINVDSTAGTTTALRKLFSDETLHMIQLYALHPLELQHLAFMAGPSTLDS